MHPTLPGAETAPLGAVLLHAARFPCTTWADAEIPPTETTDEPSFVDLIAVAEGGQTRNDTIRNALAYIRSNYRTNEQTVIVTHDAVRPFLSHRIIEQNIVKARQFGACDTVVPATDTIVESADGRLVASIPDRRNFYQGQTPQSFLFDRLDQMLASLLPEEDAILTDACKAFVLRGEQVALVEGDASNMKITYPEDLRVAEALLGAPRA